MSKHLFNDALCEKIILVNEWDEPTGTSDKWTVHKNGWLHRAFSVFIFNTNNELLLQRRATGKYHSGGLWSNTCCSHPAVHETMEESVSRRLKEEMNLQCKTTFGFKFLYKAGFSNGLTEHEIDHVFFGKSDILPQPDATEVMDWEYVSLKKLAGRIALNPEGYSEWLKICLPDVLQHYCEFLNKCNEDLHA